MVLVIRWKKLAAGEDRQTGRTHIGSAGVIAAVGFKAYHAERYAVGLGSGSNPERLTQRLAPSQWVKPHESAGKT